MDIETLETIDNLEKKKKKKKKKIIIISIVSLLIIIGAVVAIVFLIYKPTPLKEKKKIVPPKEEKQITIVDMKSNKRPIAVMIDNNTGYNNNQNHAGLQEAYLTYEIIVEGGFTRIMAIFKDKDVSLIGPVRSSRHYFLDYALESDAIYAHFGWSPYAEEDIKNLGVNNLNGLHLSEPYWRDNSISAPHNVFTTTAKLYDAASKKGYSLTSNNWQLLKYVADEVSLDKYNTEENTVAIVANNISMQYSSSQNRTYTYDTNNKVYLRNMNGAAHLDKTTKGQLNYKNIIIEKVKNYSLDSYGRQQLNTTTSGNGYYITNGYAMPITWTKETRDSKSKYTYSTGEEIKVSDGNTIIQVIPEIYDPVIN